MCGDPAAHSFVAGAFVWHDRSALLERTGATDQENQNLDVLVASPAKPFSYGFGHRYMIFDFSAIEPQTNAHLHTSFVPLHWQRDGLRLSAALALSASSNVMGHPQEYARETLQLLFALVTAREIDERLTFDYGICGDHRFGEYRVYPVAGLDWRPHPDWQLELGFPETRISYTIVEQLTSTLQLAPDGNEWRVENRDFSAASDFVYEALALQWITAWEPGPRLSLAVSLGRQLRNRYEMTLANGERISVSGEPADRLGFEVRWRF
ncbi:MAG TPA: hypothetical protein VFG91_11095 [Woeseiaceae bacterium]|nr:hypothetical protein [Woeseiaceae bacterium]